MAEIVKQFLPVDRCALKKCFRIPVGSRYWIFEPESMKALWEFLQPNKPVSDGQKICTAAKITLEKFRFCHWLTHFR